MKKLLTAILSSVAAFGLATSGYGLTIMPTFDSSITTNANGAAMMTAINAAIQAFQTNYTDNLTVKIMFVNDTNVDLGQSSTWTASYSYAAFLAALQARATSVNDTNALSKLTNSSVDPVIGGTSIYTTSAHARLLGLKSGYGPDGFDSTISFNMSLMNFTRPPTNSDDYDLLSVAEHEIDEVLGTSSYLPGTNLIRPIDLFRYDTNLNRTFTTNGDNAYLSADGTNLVARYNMDPGGDYGDWWSVHDTNRWAPPGVTPHTQVQDAFGAPGGIDDLGVSEFTALDILGYTLAGTTNTTATSPNITVVSGKGQITLSWPTNFNGLVVLEERTNLSSGSWAYSVSGATNPAVVPTSLPQKFYRLGPTPPAVGNVVSHEIQPATPPQYQLDVHVMRRRQF